MSMSLQKSPQLMLRILLKQKYLTTAHVGWNGHEQHISKNNSYESSIIINCCHRHEKPSHKVPQMGEISGGSMQQQQESLSEPASFQEYNSIYFIVIAPVLQRRK
ncbi:hypothetical protein UY3_12988 [Chelonia mydas]|uniref:Uncharacterized protein n=1 Tax=Chelonia mydas TaxID=8469 RepID=M7BCM3_CHEMY|nr:hypothetical protein UY3_12988 [Chelonia mydas]